RSVPQAMEPKQITVFLPKMFQTFLKQKPAVNQYYDAVKMESEEWLGSFCSFGPKMREKINKCDFSYFCAIAAPFAPRARYLFDNGHLRDQPQEAQRVMESLMIPMLGGHCSVDTQDRLRIVQFHDIIVERMAMIDNQFSNKLPSLEDIVIIRRESAGCRPLYHLVEYAHGLRVPDEVFENPVIQELENLGMDMVAISNDILSYRKEQQAEGVPHNMITVCRSSGMSAQKSFNTVGKLLKHRYRRWDKAEASVPSWGKEADLQVRKYIEGIKSVVRANLVWRQVLTVISSLSSHLTRAYLSFKSERYLGSNPDKVRVTRRLRILAESPAIVA
ncbi:putative pentalenene synthase, partial [Trichoderma cornu-damae]